MAGQRPKRHHRLNERFCLIYTGQRRLARNLLRDVVGRYVGNEPDSLYALNEIQKVAALMRFELERGKIDEFADLLRFYGGNIREKTEDGIMTRFKRLHREKNLCGFSHYIVDRYRKTHKTYWKNCKKRL